MSKVHASNILNKFIGNKCSNWILNKDRYCGKTILKQVLIELKETLRLNFEALGFGYFKNLFDQINAFVVFWSDITKSNNKL